MVTEPVANYERKAKQTMQRNSFVDFCCPKTAQQLVIGASYLPASCDIGVPPVFPKTYAIRIDAFDGRRR